MPSYHLPSLRSLSRRAEDRQPATLDETESKQWLQALGLPVVPEKEVTDPEGALAAAAAFGYPVVLKGRKPGLIHKTEAGLVKINLYTPAQLKAAFLEMAGLNSRPASFLVQPQLQGDLELIVGMVRDPQFGPALLVGLGGTRAEVYRDVVFRLAPIGWKR